jgi:molybdate transport system substrate-binding protein
VSTGEAALGIVYVTDAHADASVKVIATFPASSHPAIIYPAAVVASSKNPDAAAFVAFLRSPKALELFKAEGFTVLAP